MIKQLEGSEGPIIGLEITGKISLEVENEWIAKIEQMLESFDKVSILAVLGEDAGWGLKAGVEDLKWLITHLDRLDKIAIVSDSKVLDWLIKVDSQFAKLFKIGEKHFTSDNVDAAWEWIRT
jgi:hypothetical protein